MTPGRAQYKAKLKNYLLKKVIKLPGQKNPDQPQEQIEDDLIEIVEQELAKVRSKSVGCISSEYDETLLMLKPEETEIFEMLKNVYNKFEGCERDTVNRPLLLDHLIHNEKFKKEFCFENEIKEEARIFKVKKEGFLSWEEFVELLFEHKANAIKTMKEQKKTDLNIIKKGKKIIIKDQSLKKKKVMIPVKSNNSKSKIKVQKAIKLINSERVKDVIQQKWLSDFISDKKQATTSSKSIKINSEEGNAILFNKTMTEELLKNSNNNLDNYNKSYLENERNLTSNIKGLISQTVENQPSVSYLMSRAKAHENSGVDFKTFCFKKTPNIKAQMEVFQMILGRFKNSSLFKERKKNEKTLYTKDNKKIFIKKKMDSVKLKEIKGGLKKLEEKKLKDIVVM